MGNASLQRPGYGKLFLALLAISAVFLVEVIGYVVALVLPLAEDSMWLSIIPELFGAVVALLCLIGLCGREAMRPMLRDVVFAFRYGWWCMVVAVALLVFELYDYAATGTQIVPGWPQRFFEAALLCLSIGFLEEFVFRGLLFNGLLAILGRTHRGVLWAVIITSVAFGMAHVDFAADFSSASSVAQALLKITQISMYSVMLCVIVLRTHGLYGVSVFHAVDDFLVFLPGVVLYGESTEVDYVVEGDEAYYSIMFYLVIIVLYLPLLIKALLDLHRCQDVWQGLFMEHERRVNQSLPVPAAPTMPVPVSSVAPVSGPPTTPIPGPTAAPPVAAPVPAAVSVPETAIVPVTAASSVPVPVSVPVPANSVPGDGRPPVPSGLAREDGNVNA